MTFSTLQKYVIDGLLNARHTDKVWTPGHFDAALTLEDAYRIQQQVAVELGWFDEGRPRLWKAGGNPPMGAPLPHVLDSGAKWSVAGHDEGLLIEAELAFRLDKTPSGPDDVEECIGSVCASIELVGTRLAGGMQAPLAWKMADQQVHVGLVIGNEIAFAMTDWSEQRCRVTVNGNEVANLKGTHPTGNPLGALQWLASHAEEYYDGLRAGDLITTGAWYLGPAGAGDTVEVEFDGVGTVKVDIAS